MLALTAPEIATPAGVKRDHAVLIDAGRIKAVVARPDVPAGARGEMLDGLLAPGFFDIQVNGGGGVLLNDQPDVEGLAQMARAHRGFGTTALLPTLISDTLDAIAKTIATVEAAIAAGLPGVVGIHIEGPFLAPARKGVHDAGKFRTLSEADLDLLTGLKGGATLITVAPEAASPEMIAGLTARGAIVALGHSDTSYETATAALKSGASGFTHLYNAMSPLTSRAPGMVGAALDSANAWASVIADYRHVHPAALRVAAKAMDLSRLVLVTDAMHAVGAPDLTEFTLFGHKVRVDGYACVTEDGTLAGSNLDMMAAVRHASDMFSIPLAEAAALASRNPARAR
jgi:N-acetylglucosamine-6-phosphate deacetylase